MNSPDARFRFTFDDVVRIVGQDPELDPIRGELAVVVGRGDDGTSPGYGVWVYSLQRVWSVEEDEIEGTGQRDVPPPPTQVIRVAVDAEGRGNLVGVRDVAPKAASARRVRFVSILVGAGLVLIGLAMLLNRM